MRELTDEQWEEEMISFAVDSPSAMIYLRESIAEVLAVLTEREREILILSAAGFDNHQIADYLFYKNNKIVATRLAQIIGKVQKSVAKIQANPSSK
jgi:DNA-binding NarL/FixJ family response regulator